MARSRPSRGRRDVSFRHSSQLARNDPHRSRSAEPAVILFRYHPGMNFFEEPVYNTDVAWPDDAPIIRAHDLGWPRDRQIVEYYAGQDAPPGVLPLRRQSI